MKRAPIKRDKSSSTVRRGAADTRLQFKPLLTKRQFEIGESRSSGSGDIAIARRLSLAVLTKSSLELLEGLNDEKGQEAFLELIETVASFVRHSEALAELARAAEIRVASVANEFLELHKP